VATPALCTSAQTSTQKGQFDAPRHSTRRRARLATRLPRCHLTTIAAGLFAIAGLDIVTPIVGRGMPASKVGVAGEGFARS